MTDYPLQIGPFELDEPIGEGGMGSVWRAHHGRTGVDVALKLVKGEGDEFRDRFHREIQAHAELVHPGIVYLFDYGEIDEQTAGRSGQLTADSPWVAMQLADVGTVRDLMPLAGWHQVRHILVQTLDALAHAHARDVIHRDLKPENLLVFGTDEALRIKLADFGIAHARDEVENSRTDQLETPVGTPLYMAPEQIQGRWRRYGSWTDLYALGCITYQLVCGRPPFVADNPVSLMIHHCDEERPALDPQFPVPDGLEAWVRRLMAIETRDRFWRAADALRTLPVGRDLPVPTARDEADLESMETIPAGDAPTEAAPTKTITLPTTEILTDASSPSGGSGPEPTGEGSMGAVEQPRGSLPDWRTDDPHDIPTPLVGTGLGLFDLRESPFVDRHDERDVIWDALADVVESDEFRVVLLCGRSGTGKSRLARWIIHRADELAVAGVLETKYTAGGSGYTEGFGGLVLRASYGWRLNRGEFYDHLLDILPKLPDESADLREADVRALTELVMPTDQSDENVDGPRYSFDTTRQKYLLMERFLRRVGLERPPLAWFDNLQWGAEATGLLEYLIGREDRPRGLVIATIRSEALAQRPPLAERIERLERDEATERLDLEPLASRDHRTFIDQLLPLTDDLAERIAARTEGNPLFAHQLLGDLVSSDYLESGEEGFELAADFDLELPDDIHELWETRLTRLLRTHFPEDPEATGASVELAAVSGRDVDEREWRTACEIAGLEVRDGLVDRLVEYGLAERTEAGWSFAHGMFVDSLKRYAAEAGRLGAHHRHCARMLERLYPDEPHRTARRRADHFIEADRPADALRPLLEQQRRLRQMDAYRQELRVLERRRELLDELGVSDSDRARLENDIAYARAAGRLGELEAPSERFESLNRRCRIADEPDLAARCLLEMGRCQLYSSSEQSPKALFAQALEYADRAGNPELIGRARLALGWQAFTENDYGGAREHAGAAIDMLPQTAAYDRLRARHLDSWSRLDCGEFDAAQSQFEDRLAEARELGNRFVEADAFNALGDLARYRSETDKSRRYYRRALETARGTGDLQLRVIGHHNLAQIELVEKRADRAREHLEAIDRVAPETDKLGRFEWLLESTRASVAAATGRFDDFDEYFDTFEEGWPESVFVTRDVATQFEFIAETCIEADKHRRARRALEVAAQLWERLGDEEAVERVERRLADL